jgi:hypothetical protein
MERESLLAILIILLGGLTFQLFAAWPMFFASGVRTDQPSAARQLEQRYWYAVWRPAAPAVMVVAWLCGWALSQPDPVPHHVGWWVMIAPLPFALVVTRALLRAGWSLWGPARDHGIATVGLIRPQILFAPEIAKALDDRAIEAALAHQRARVRHRDPLRIWLAQFVTDLQWPWGAAQRRLSDWLQALECARDEEVRAAGVEGADLAAAVLGSVRFQLRDTPAEPALRGAPSALTARIGRLLTPLCASAPRESRVLAHAGSLLLGLLSAVALGLVCGERLIGPLL